MLREGINALSSTIWAARELILLEETDSTNVQAAKAAAEGAPHGTLVTAEKQTAGRGRRGRTWESPAGKNLYFTLLLRPQFGPEKASMLTLVMACSVGRTIRQMTGLSCGIKWPNDIVVNGKKVCGILTEMSVGTDKIDHVLIGVGINVGLQEFTPELRDRATSLENETGCEVEREALLVAIMQAFEEDYELFAKWGGLRPLLDEYQSMLLNRDARVRVLDPLGEYEGTALGITETGELKVLTDDGRITEVYAGEVSVRGVYGYI